MKLLFRFINPIVRLILKSPIHFLISHQILLFRVVGRRSKRIFEIPASFAHINDSLVCVTLRENLWWKIFKVIETKEIYFKEKKLLSNYTGDRHQLFSNTKNMQHLIPMYLASLKKIIKM